MNHCGGCRAARKHRHKPPPCAECEHREPRLMLENADIWRLWARVQRQWRHNGFGPMGLDLPAVYLVAGTMGLEMTEQTLDLLLALEDETLVMERQQTATG